MSSELGGHALDDDGRRPAPGRPRNPGLNARIATVTRGLLADVGYNKLSFEMIAQACGVTRPTLYRRWPSKAHLVFDATLPDHVDGIPDTGDLAHDVRAFIRQTATMFSEPSYRAAFPGLLADLPGNQDVMSDVWTAIRAEFCERLGRARKRGDITAQVDPQDLLDMIVGAMFQRVIVLQGEYDHYIDVLTTMTLRLLDYSPSSDVDN